MTTCCVDARLRVLGGEVGGMALLSHHLLTEHPYLRLRGSIASLVSVLASRQPGGDGQQAGNEQAVIHGPVGGKPPPAAAGGERWVWRGVARVWLAAAGERLELLDEGELSRVFQQPRVAPRVDLLIEGRL